MATIEKRTTDKGTAYRVKVRLRGFPPETATFERLTDAREWAKTIEADMKKGRHFGQSKRHTFTELADEYAPHAKDKVRLDYWRECIRFRPSRRHHPGPHRQTAGQVAGRGNATLCHAPTGDKEADAKRPKAKRSGPTVNRYLAALSVCMAHGVKELRWLEKNPCELVKKPKENKGACVSCPMMSARSCWPRAVRIRTSIWR